MNKELFDKGLNVRREVLDAEYVDKSIATADDFNRPMQELVTSTAGARSGTARGWTGAPARSSTWRCSRR